MTSREAFALHCVEQKQKGYWVSEGDFEAGWEASQAQQAQTIAELVEALEQCNLCISSAVRIESTAFDEPPSPVSEWDYHADILSSEITRLIAKVKGK